mmetsp:Transcript_19473/g.53585  ORF Transcript_19473/g.53585 Transcript_19473/m.53585 type:complete len:96 (+) Transcript_19473:753-1040(+)
MLFLQRWSLSSSTVLVFVVVRGEERTKVDAGGTLGGKNNLERRIIVLWHTQCIQFFIAIDKVALVRKAVSVLDAIGAVGSSFVMNRGPNNNIFFP